MKLLITILLTSLVHCKDRDGEISFTSDTNFYAADNKLLILKCKSFHSSRTGHQEIEIYLPSGIKAATNDHIKVSVDGFKTITLQIIKFKKSRDDGTYKCVRSSYDKNGKKKTDEISKVLKYEKSFHLTVLTSNLTVKAFSNNSPATATFSIVYKAFPPPIFIWSDRSFHELTSFDGESPQLAKYGEIYAENNFTLRIFDVDVTESGNYTISVSNLAGKQNVSVELLVYGKPNIRCPHNSMFKEGRSLPGYSNDEIEIKHDGDEVKKSFLVFGCPLANLSTRFRLFADRAQWTDGSLSLESNLTITRKAEEISKCLQSFEVVLNPKDPGLLTVDMVNDYGTTNHVTKIKIGEERDQIKLYNVTYSKSSKRNEAASGDDIALECQTSMYKALETRWSKNGQLMSFTDSSDIQDTSTKYSRKEKVFIKNVTKADEGVYECQLIRKAPANVQSIKEEIVVMQSSPATIKELFVKTPWVKLQCVATGYPCPIISWLMDGKPMHNEREQKNSTKKNEFSVASSLNVTGINKGNFSCIAENKAGRDVKSIAISKDNILLYVITLFLSTIVFLTAAFSFKIYQDRKLIREMKEAGLSNFVEGNLESIDPDVALNQQADLLPYDQQFEFPLESLKFMERLGSGAYGVVVKAKAKGIVTTEAETIVAVKTVAKNADNSITKTLVSELKIMIHLGKHLNIVNLLGAVTKNIVKRELFVIIEYCCFGNLRDYLRKHRKNFGNLIVNGKIIHNEPAAEESSSAPSEPHYASPRRTYANLDVSNTSFTPAINTANLLSWSYQVARGMDYLASKKVFHGDLAARNVLLARHGVVKICDFGLAKSWCMNYSYKRNQETPLPIKWLALEAIMDQIFSIRSDIWAYGIFLWEIFTLGQAPYQGIGNEDILNKLLAGYRMSQPEFSTNAVYDVMLECWKTSPSARPSFSDLERRFANMLDKNSLKCS